MVETPKELQISHTKINELATVKSWQDFLHSLFCAFWFVCFLILGHTICTVLDPWPGTEPAPPAVDVQDCQASPHHSKDTMAEDKALIKRAEHIISNMYLTSEHLNV